MASTNFQNNSTPAIDAEWLNEVNKLVHELLNIPATLDDVRSALQTERLIVDTDGNKGNYSQSKDSIFIAHDTKRVLRSDGNNWKQVIGQDANDISLVGTVNTQLSSSNVNDALGELQGNRTKAVPTVDDIKSKDHSGNQYIQASGYKKEGDEGFGWYWLDDSNPTANGANILADTAGNKFVALQKVVDVSRYGDINTDIGAAINNALNAGFKTMVVPEGTFPQTTQIDDLPFTLATMGPYSVTTGSTTIRKEFNGEHFAGRTTGITLIGIKFEGNKANGFTGNGATIKNKPNFFGVAFVDQKGDGVHFLVDSGSANINDAELALDCSNNDGNGCIIEDTTSVSLIDTNTLRVYNLECKDNGGDGFVKKSGLHCEYYFIQCDRNANNGVLLDGQSNIKQNRFHHIYAENNGTNLASSNPSNINANYFGTLRGGNSSSIPDNNVVFDGRDFEMRRSGSYGRTFRVKNGSATSQNEGIVIPFENGNGITGEFGYDGTNAFQFVSKNGQIHGCRTLGDHRGLRTININDGPNGGTNDEQLQVVRFVGRQRVDKNSTVNLPLSAVACGGRFRISHINSGGSVTGTSEKKLHFVPGNSPTTGSEESPQGPAANVTIALSNNGNNELQLDLSYSSGNGNFFEFTVDVELCLLE